uniref:Uncharacterized protein n=1 Tax=Vitrella brassicaformis TaxID=1169539 RepID=A0A7S1K446_9ALVE
MYSDALPHAATVSLEPRRVIRQPQIAQIGVGSVAPTARQLDVSVSVKAEPPDTSDVAGQAVDRQVRSDVANQSQEDDESQQEALHGHLGGVLLLAIATQANSNDRQ